MAHQPNQIIDLGAVPPVKNYHELLLRASTGAEEPTPARLVSSYRYTDVEGGAAVPTPEALREQTLAISDRQPLAFLCLLRKPEGGVEVRILHRLMRYYELPGGGAPGFTDKVLGLLGDVRPSQYPVVEVSPTVFHRVGPLGYRGVRVPDLATMLNQLEAAPEIGLLGPFGADVPNTEVIRPRYVQAIPNRYAAMLVHRDGLTPADAYRELLGMFEADGVIAACSDILGWLRVACTAKGGADEQEAGQSGTEHRFPILLLPPPVGEYVATKVHSDLPGVRGANGRGGVAGPEVEQLVGAVNRLAENAVGNNDRNANREAKTIIDTYRETYTLLLRFCQVNTVDNVAPLWSRLANCSKNEQQSVIQQELTKVCLGRGLAPDIYCPVETTGLRQMVISLNFPGFGPDDLASGCQPFLVTYTGASDYYRAQENASVAQQLEQGAANATLADIRELKEKERIKLPRDLAQVGLTLQRYAVLVHALFQCPGDTNTFVRNVWMLANSFQARLPQLVEKHLALTGTPWADSYAAHVLRHVQTNIYEYMQGVQVGDVILGQGLAAIEVPTFKSLMVVLQRGNFHTSGEWIPLPTALLEPSPARALSVASGRSTAASTRSSSVSTLTGGTNAGGRPGDTTAAPAPAPALQSFVTNPARDPEFDALQLRPQMRELLRAHPPPTNDAGQEFCVSWWGRGGCYSNCGRRATHRPFANSAERGRLLAHVRAHLTVPTAAANSGT